jgi:CRP/FNR family transcriptional regulator
MLFRAGDPMGPFFKLTAGVVAVSKLLDDGRRQVVALRAAGDCIGYLEENGRYAFEGRALTDVDACTFDRRLFDEFAALNPDLAAATTEALAIALRQAGEAMLVLGQMRSVERVAHFLIEIDALYRDRGARSESLSLMMNRAEVADYLGLTLETVSRALGKLKAKGIIVLGQRDQVKILDRDGLRKIGKA